MAPTSAQIAAAIKALLAQRAAQSSICPSEAARALLQDEAQWRALMPKVRAVAAALAQQGELRITRGDAELPPHEIDGGPIRLRRGPQWCD